MMIRDISLVLFPSSFGLQIFLKREPQTSLVHPLFKGIIMSFSNLGPPSDNTYKVAYFSELISVENFYNIITDLNCQILLEVSNDLH